MNARAFEELVVRHQGIVCGVAYAVLRDRAMSEEIAQEAFLVAWQKQVHAPAWICAVARNLARNAARRRGEVRMPEGIEEPVALTRDARDALIAHEDTRRANAALARLPSALREAIVVYYHGDESMEEVAAALDISHAAAKQRVHRGREQLREQLAPVESHLRRARPGAAFTGACVAAWLSRGSAEAATPTATAPAAMALAATAPPAAKATAMGWLGAFAIAGGFATGATIGTPRDADAAGALFAAGTPPLERLTLDPAPRSSRLPVLSAMAMSGDPEALGPDAPFSMRSNGGTLKALTWFLQSTINVPIRVADGFDAPVNLDVDEVPVIQVLDDLIAQAHGKRTEIAAVRIVQQGGRTDAATLGGDRITLHLYDVPMFDVISRLEPALHMPIFRDVVAGQMPGPSSIGGEWYIRNCDTNELELVPHVTIDLVDVTAGEALAQILEQTGLGYARATGYLIEPLADE